MGVCLTSRKSKHVFDMGYGGFQSLRTNIAKAWDSELGEAYADTLMAVMHPKEYNQRINEIITNDRFKDEDEDLLDFLFSSDCGGKCSYKTCRKIYQLIKDIDFTPIFEDILASESEV